MIGTLTEGFEIKKIFEVTENETALKVGSGGLKVLATPVLACWVEEAAYNLVQLNIGKEYSSVGTRLDINHISPTPVNMRVSVKISVKEIDNRKIVFTFKAWDEVQEIADGIHERVIINSEKFQEKANLKNESK